MQKKPYQIRTNPRSPGTHPNPLKLGIQKLNRGGAGRIVRKLTASASARANASTDSEAKLVNAEPGTGNGQVLQFPLPGPSSGPGLLVSAILCSASKILRSGSLSVLEGIDRLRRRDG